MLTEGTYTVVLIGKNFAYYDTLHVPANAPDSLFQFHITVFDISTYQKMSNFPIELRIDDTIYTQIKDTTDHSGNITITYENTVVDTITYNIFSGIPAFSMYFPSHFGQTRAVKGIPEVITLGVCEH